MENPEKCAMNAPIELRCSFYIVILRKKKAIWYLLLKNKNSIDICFDVEQIFNLISKPMDEGKFKTSLLGYRNLSLVFFLDTRIMIEKIYVYIFQHLHIIQLLLKDNPKWYIW